MSRISVLALGSFLLASTGLANGAELVGWSINGFIDSSAVLPANRATMEISSSGLSRSSGLGSMFVSDAFLLSGWPIGASVDLTRFLECGVNVADGFECTFSTIAFSVYSDSGGNAGWQLRSSADGYASVLASGTAVNVSGSGSAVLADVSTLGTRAGLTTFRLYFYNNTGLFNRDRRGINGTNKGGVGLSVNGSVAMVATDPPRIDDIAIIDGLVRLEVSELSPAGSTIVQHADPYPATTWSDVETFANTSSSMSWTASTPAVVDLDLFRLQASP